MTATATKSTKTTTTRKATVPSTRANQTRKPAAPKASPKPTPAPAPKAQAKTTKAVKATKIQTEPLTGMEVRPNVDDVNADWSRDIPGVHNTDSGCGKRFVVGEARSAAWLKEAFDANYILGEEGKARTFWFHTCVIRKVQAAAPAPAVVEIDLSNEETAEVDALVAEHAPELAQAALEAAGEDADHELAEIKAEVAAAIAPKPVRTPAKRTAARKPRTTK